MIKLGTSKNLFPTTPKKKNQIKNKPDYGTMMRDKRDSPELQCESRRKYGKERRKKLKEERENLKT